MILPKGLCVNKNIDKKIRYVKVEYFLRIGHTRTRRTALADVAGAKIIFISRGFGPIYFINFKMRRYIKRQCQETLATLLDANRQIKEWINNNGNKSYSLPDEFYFLLEDCQEAAIAVGNVIEEQEDGETGTVKELEVYCELLYEFSTGIERSIYKLDAALNGAMSELNKAGDQLEIIFLPYKASMWDSLESIYFEAKKDLKCEPVVIPVPYYDKNPDGSLGMLHYEGDAFPGYVDIKDYREYDIKERHPDVIFIHNPYDNYNKVTTIIPKFYSHVIKQYTDLLVYVPYFIFPGKFTEHFAYNPGVVLADRVYVQNEETRQGYINALRNFDKNSSAAELKKKIISSGSPKTDKIINFKTNDFDLPAEWADVLNGKRVIFFNTNVSMIINNEHNIIENIRRIFGTIKKHSEFRVIWREHPLTEETLKSMAYGIMKEYHELKDEFLSEGIGVIDNMPDAYPAMHLSDCYYGAGGSLSALYPVTGKPILITDYHYPEQISEKEISLEDFIKTATLRLMYNERNINSLDLFLDNIDVFIGQKDERIKRQSIRMENLDGTVGRLIYESVKSALNNI